jgi:hypothetical protein
MRLIILLFFLGGVGGQQTYARAPEIEIEKRCRDDFPSLIDYFSRRKCIAMELVALEQQRQAAAEKAAADERERSAASCLSHDIRRMETLASTVSTSISSQMSRDQIIDFLNTTLGQKIEVRVGLFNIKESVITTFIRSSCNSIFHISVSIFLSEAGKPRSVVFGVNVKPGTNSLPPLLFGRHLYDDTNMEKFNRRFDVEEGVRR